MQAYLNDSSMKAFILQLLYEEHQGLPPIKWPDDPTSTGVDYEVQLGIPMTVAVVARDLHLSPARVAAALAPLFAAGHADPDSPAFAAAARALGVSTQQLNTALVHAKQSLAGS